MFFQALEWRMLVAAAWGGTGVKLHASHFKLHALTGTPFCFGTHFIQVKLQILSSGGDPIALSLLPMHIQLIFVAWLNSKLRWRRMEYSETRGWFQAIYLLQDCSSWIVLLYRVVVCENISISFVPMKSLIIQANRSFRVPTWLIIQHDYFNI